MSHMHFVQSELTFCDNLALAAFATRSLSPRERPSDKFDGVAEES